MNPRTVALLARLPGLVADLETELVEATPEPSSSSGKPTSRPPLSLPVVSDIEEAWNVLTTWARDWCETYDLRGPNGAWTWDSVCHWLGEHYATTAAGHPALADFDDEVVAEERRLRRHLGTRRDWAPLPGRLACPVDGCGGLLLAHSTAGVIRCRACGETWDEPQFERLGMVLGCNPVPVPLRMAADRSQLPVSTLRRWCVTGRLPATRTAGGDWRVDMREVWALVDISRFDIGG